MGHSVDKHLGVLLCGYHPGYCYKRLCARMFLNPCFKCLRYTLYGGGVSHIYANLFARGSLRPLSTEPSPFGPPAENLLDILPVSSHSMHSPPLAKHFSLHIVFAQFLLSSLLFYMTLSKRTVSHLESNLKQCNHTYQHSFHPKKYLLNELVHEWMKELPRQLCFICYSFPVNNTCRSESISNWHLTIPFFVYFQDALYMLVFLKQHLYNFPHIFLMPWL